MNKTYIQLTSEERDRIAVLRAQEKNSSDIAWILGRSKSTICRELKRNKSPVYGIYLSHKAHERAAKRKYEAALRPRLKDSALMGYVIKKLRRGWSPEQIAGRIAQELPGQSISHEAIYQFIYDRQTLKEMDLRPLLPRRHRKRLPYGHSRKHRKLHIPQRVSINERPAAINERLEYGHWEADTMIARQSVSSLGIALERLSRRMHIAKLPAQTARNLRTALNRRLGRHPQHLRKSITYDNGAENVEHMLTNKVLGTKSYFCEPYHSWEKGAVENGLSLIRRFLPKKTNFDTITTEEVKQIETLLNNRPRKCLSFKTPNEVFNQAVALAP
jgi:transposase, IS30 family